MASEEQALTYCWRLGIGVDSMVRQATSVREEAGRGGWSCTEQKQQLVARSWMWPHLGARTESWAFHLSRCGGSALVEGLSVMGK